MGIGIVDYGAGNLHSVAKALAFLGFDSRIVAAPEALAGVDRLILPGVGNFGRAVETLDGRGLSGALKAWIGAGRPFLGICLGLQLLFRESEESPGTAGLGAFDGRCLRFRSGKVPQMGWNSVSVRRPSPLFEGLTEGAFFYMVHGYFAAPADESVVIGMTDYGVRYASAIGRGRVFGVQFHPEKSGADGLRLLKNWVDRC